MIAPTDIEQTIRAILRAHSHDIELTPDLPLGSHGMGLDSIGLVEVLVECEMRLGVLITSDLLAGQVLTVGELIEAVRSRERNRVVG